MQKPDELTPQERRELTFIEHINYHKSKNESSAEQDAYEDLIQFFSTGDNPISTCEPGCECKMIDVVSNIFISHLNYSNESVPLPLETDYSQSSNSIDPLLWIAFKNSQNAIIHPLCVYKLRETSPQNSTTSFKFHISIQNFSDTKIGHMIKLGQFLKEKSSSEKHLNFFFKMVVPSILQKKIRFAERESGNEHFMKKLLRFLNCDQFTLYFNRYSSLGAMLRLADDVEKFLIDSGYQASPPNGYKDIITINQFFSARNDGFHSDNSYYYGYLEFFDHECRKFIDKYRDELKATDNLPIGAFEIILHICLAIPNLTVSETLEISEEHSEIIQNYFIMLKDNPKDFIAKAQQIIIDLKGHQDSKEEEHDSSNSETTDTDEEYDSYNEDDQNDSTHEEYDPYNDDDQNDNTNEEYEPYNEDYQNDNNPDKDDQNSEATDEDDHKIAITSQNNHPATQSSSLLSKSLFKGLQITSALGLSTIGMLLCFNIVMSNPISLPIGILILMLAAYLFALASRKEAGNLMLNGTL